VPINVIPNGIDLDRFARAAPKRKADLGLPPEALVLMYVGRLGPEKNLVELLRAFRNAYDAAPNTLLALVGDGPQAEALRRTARDLDLNGSVRFLGTHPNEDVPSLLGAADAFVTASITEAHPMTIIEALAAGCPVLGFNVPGIRETVIDGVDGLLAPADPVALGRHMARVATDAALRARLSEGALRSAQDYSIEATTRRILDHYERLIRQRQAR
jgi:glycosyltransferase involved in cell wall biosynthesis